VRTALDTLAGHRGSCCFRFSSNHKQLF